MHTNVKFEGEYLPIFIITNFRPKKSKKINYPLKCGITFGPYGGATCIINGHVIGCYDKNRWKGVYDRCLAKSRGF